MTQEGACIRLELASARSGHCAATASRSPHHRRDNRMPSRLAPDLPKQTELRWPGSQQHSGAQHVRANLQVISWPDRKWSFRGVDGEENLQPLLQPRQSGRARSAVVFGVGAFAAAILLLDLALRAVLAAFPVQTRRPGCRAHLGSVCSRRASHGLRAGEEGPVLRRIWGGKEAVRGEELRVSLQTVWQHNLVTLTHIVRGTGHHPRPNGGRSACPRRPAAPFAAVTCPLPVDDRDLLQLPTRGRVFLA
eukprot:scaffold3161_cov118-Isochrysis_galbana.AAC.17